MPLKKDKPVTFSQGRHGEVYVTQGYGYDPEVMRASSIDNGTLDSIGLTGPTVAPAIEVLPTSTIPDPDFTPPEDNPDAEAPDITVRNITYYVARLDIEDSGARYTEPPLISIDGHTPDQDASKSKDTTSPLPPRKTPIPGSTEEASAICRLSKDYVSETEMIDPGRGFPAPPTVTLSGGARTDPPDTDPPTPDEDGEANLVPIVRATLRGKYQCYYRFVDNRVLPEEGGPIYSNLSPVTEVDAGDGLDKITWTLPNVPAGLDLELWRSSSNQAIVVYRLGEWKSDGTQTIPAWGDSYAPTAGKFLDDIHDNELLDPLREGFQALPITLPNGQLNANRFTPPPNDYAVGVFFQDRWWMGVHAPANNNDKPQPNTLRYSEQNEPGSMPDVNELIVQQNLRTADFITALVPYAGALLVMQSRHSHRLTYVTQPVIDAGISLFAYRGCLNQRCWDIYEGRCYAMDSSGIYSVNPQGELDDLSVGIDDIFSEKIDWSKSKWFIVRAERSLNVIRASVAYVGDPGEYPTRQLVYALDYKAWWEERYPSLLTSGCDVRKPSGQNAVYYGTDSGKIFELGSGTTDSGTGWVKSCTVDDAGRGYRRAPEVTAVSTTGSGAEFEASIDSNGSLTGIVVKHCGTNYSEGDTVAVSTAPKGGTSATASMDLGDNANPVPVHYSIKTGNMEFVNDTVNPKDDSAQNRQVSVVYRPTEGSSVLNLETYYNGAEVPRSNVVRRDRGVGFVNSDSVPAATLDMKATDAQLAESTGVARALFAGRTLDDIDGNDRHIAVGLTGKQDQGQVVIHSVDVHGVLGGE